MFDVAGWPDLHGFEGGERKNAKNTMHTEGKRGRFVGKQRGK